MATKMPMILIRPKLVPSIRQHRQHQQYRSVLDHRGRRYNHHGHHNHQQQKQHHRSASSTSTSFIPFFSIVVSWYGRQLDRYPLTTKCLSSGIVASMGDLICQSMTVTSESSSSLSSPPSDLSDDSSVSHGGTDGDGAEHQHQRDQLRLHRQQDLSWDWDWKRTGRFFIMGCCWVAPCTHYWYTALNMKLVPGPSTIRRVTTRVLLDQTLFAPIFCPSFMGLLWLLEGRGYRQNQSSSSTSSSSFEELGKDLLDVTPDIIRANWFVWIPANAINFSVVPLQYQVLYGNVVALCWNVFLSHKSQWKRQE